MSGIYIPDVALPERGEGYSLFLYPDGRVHLWRGPEAKVGHEFMAVSVPYHRRLIDADALASMYDPNTDFGKSVRDMIRDCPTIIPADELFDFSEQLDRGGRE